MRSQGVQSTRLPRFLPPRVAHYRVAAFDKASLLIDVLLRESGQVVVDLEGTLIPSGANLLKHIDEVNDRLRHLAGLPQVDRVIIVTNQVLTKAEMAQVAGEVVSNARKPWTPLRRLDVEPKVVVGNEWCTDGLLAWLHSATFVRVAEISRRLPFPTRLRERFFIAGKRFFFSDEQ